MKSKGGPDTLFRQAEAEAVSFQLPSDWAEGRPHIHGFAIDSTYSPDIDDIVSPTLDDVSFATIEDRPYFQVSIADLGTFIPPHSAMALMAQKRVASKYVGEIVANPMFPRPISEHKLSLLHDRLRPTITVRAPIGGPIKTEDISVFRTLTRARRISYDEVNRLIREGSSEEALTLHGLHQAARLSFAARYGKGVGPQEAFAEDETTSANFGRRRYNSRRTPGELIVAESMIACNAIMARFAWDNQIPVYFRNHIVPKFQIPNVANPHRRAQLLGKLGNASYGLESHGHAELNLPAYTHFTSPIRRFADFVFHVNLAAFLDGREYPYPPEYLQEIEAWINAVERGQRGTFDTSKLPFTTQVPALAGGHAVARQPRPAKKVKQPAVTLPRKQQYDYLKTRFAEGTATPGDVEVALFNPTGTNAQKANIGEWAAGFISHNYKLARKVIGVANDRKHITLVRSEAFQPIAIQAADGQVYPFEPKGSPISQAFTALRVLGELSYLRLIPEHPDVNLHFFERCAAEGRLHFVHTPGKQPDGQWSSALEVRLVGQTGQFVGIATTRKEAVRMACARAQEEFDLIANPPDKYSFFGPKGTSEFSSTYENPSSILAARQQTNGLPHAEYTYTTIDVTVFCHAIAFDVGGKEYSAMVEVPATDENARRTAKHAAADKLLQRMPKRPLDKRGRKTY